MSSASSIGSVGPVNVFIQNFKSFKVINIILCTISTGAFVEIKRIILRGFFLFCENV